MVAPDDVQKRIDRMNCMLMKDISEAYSSIGNDLSIVRGSSPVYIDEAPEVVVEKVDKILDKLQSVMEAMDYEYLARSGVTE